MRFSAAAGSLADAVRFLTVLPIPSYGSGRGRSLSQAVAYFPVVGALLGIAVTVVDTAGRRAFPSSVVSAFDLMLFAALTGGLHLDGLMDSCDGLFGGHDPEHRLAIMRDSRVGSFGVLGGLFFLLLDYVCLTTLHGYDRAAGLILAPTLGRWSMVLALNAFSAARAEGRGATFKADVGRREVLLASLWTLLIVAAVDPASLRLAALAGLAALALGKWIAARLGGLTGDSYGAVCEVITALTLCLISMRYA